MIEEVANNHGKYAKYEENIMSNTSMLICLKFPDLKQSDVLKDGYAQILELAANVANKKCDIVELKYDLKRLKLKLLFL